VSIYIKNHCSHYSEWSRCCFTFGETTLSTWSESEEIKAEQITAWEESRLVIIDEISLASKHEIQKIHKHLGWLLEETQKKYGGISLSFLILDKWNLA
jgi:hypothetical protein